MMTLGLAGFGCNRSGSPGGQTEHDDMSEQPTASDTAPDDMKYAVFAGGCFWCTEGVFQEIDGVTEVVSGYTGGTADTATYEQVSTGRTDHAEAIRITYDPNKVSYDKLLEVHFATHDPTQVNRQGPDVGPQYRSAVFYADAEAKAKARAHIDQLQASGVYDKPIATTLEPLEGFYEAEDYHQDFVDRNPNQGYVRMHAQPKIDKVRKQFPDEVKR